MNITCPTHKIKFTVPDGCPKCLGADSGEKVTLKIKVTAPPGAPEGEEEKVAGEIVKLAETIAEIQGAPKPVVERLETTALVQIYPHGERDVVDLLNEAQAIAERAEAFTVTSEADVKAATNDLSIIAGVKKKIEGKKKEYLEPLETHKKSITAAFALLLDPITSADKSLRSKTNTYLTEQRERAAEAEKIAREEQDLARRKAELNGTPAPEPEKIPTTFIQQTYRAELGMSGQMDVWKWEPVNKALIPAEYWKLDDAKITAEVKASKGSKVIAGIRVFNEPTLRVEARKS